MVPRAVADVRRKYPNLLIDLDVLKIEEAVDYLLLGKGELVAMSFKIDHPMLAFAPLAKGRLKCVVPLSHPLAGRSTISAREVSSHPLIGIDPNDPFGRIMVGIFASLDLAYDVTIRARFGSTVCALVSNGLGIAVIDEFTLAGGNWPDLRALDISETTSFQTYVAYRKDQALSAYGQAFVAALRGHMQHTSTRTPAAQPNAPARSARKK
jgi:DNA-binding transcriptional LysR family regulator